MELTQSIPCLEGTVDEVAETGWETITEPEAQAFA